MFLFPSKYLIAAVIIHGLFGCFEDLMLILFAKAPVPLGNFYNASLKLHYGITLNEDGVGQIMSLLSSLQLFGTLVSLVFVVGKMDSYGRRTVAIYFRATISFLAVGLMFLGWLFTSLELFAGGSILIGVALPLKNGVTRLYLSECSPDEIRGFITQGLSTVGGFVVISCAFLFLPNILGNDANWHYVFFIAIFAILIFTIGAFFIPESPKFLWMNQKKEETIKAIKAFQGKDADIVTITSAYEHEYCLINSKASHTNIREILADPGLRDSLKLVFATALVTTLGPLQIYTVYSITSKIKFGFTNSHALTFELICNCISLPIGLTLPFLYEKIGRRPIFLLNTVLSLWALCFMFFAESIFEFNGSNSNWITFVFASLFTICIDLTVALGISAFSIILIADLLPATAKAATTQAIMFSTSILAILFNFLYSFLLPILGFSIYFPIILVQIFLFVYLYRNLPETKQKAVYQNYEQLLTAPQSKKVSLLFRSRIGTYNYGQSKKVSILFRPRISTYNYGTV